MAITDNLVALWKLNEASGNALDTLGSNDLTETSGTIDAATGLLGNSRDFEGADTEYFSHADNPALSTGDIDVTMTFWIKPESLTGFPAIASKGDSNPATANTEWIIWYNSSTNRLTFSVCSGTTYKDCPANTFGALSNGTRYFVAVKHDSVNNLIGISINNGPFDTVSHSTGINDGNRDFVIGGSVLQSLYWDGEIEQFAFFKRVVGSSDLATIYNGGAAKDYPWATNYTMTAAAGSFALSGQAAALKAARLLTAAAGGFALTGRVATLTIARKLTAAAGSFALTGQPANLLAARSIVASTGSFSLTGNAAAFARTYAVTADAGSFSLTGGAATLTYSGETPTPPTPSTPTGLGSGGYDRYRRRSEPKWKPPAPKPAPPEPIPELRRYVMVAAAGQFNLTGFPAELRVDRVLSATSADYRTATPDADLRTDRRMIAARGDYQTQSPAAQLRTGHIFDDLAIKTELTELLALDETGIAAAYCARVQQLLYPTP